MSYELRISDWSSDGCSSDLAAVVLPLYYRADASLTRVRRAWRRERLWRAHREHFYQRAVQRGFSHAAVALRVLACNVLLVGLALLASVAPGAALRWSALLLALLAVGILLAMLARQAPPPAWRDPIRPSD